MPNIKRATIWGLILFLIIFVITTILVLISPDMHLIIGVIFWPFGIFLYSKFVYFRKEGTEAAIKEGFIVGLYWSIISIICDIILVVDVLGFGWELFSSPSSWALYVHYAEIVVFTILGALTEKKL